jgi:uncharacterized protein YbjQ (UPF0145 family)
MNGSESKENQMANIIPVVIFTLCLAIGLPAHARDTRHLLPIAVAMETKDAQDKLDGSVKFYFGDQPQPKAGTVLGSDVSNRKTNAFGKSDEKACNWAFLSAMVALEKRAQQLGANAVINIVSYYNKKVMSSATEFECHAGAIIAGVALKGDFVKIADG